MARRAVFDLFRNKAISPSLTKLNIWRKIGLKASSPFPSLLQASVSKRGLV